MFSLRGVGINLLIALVMAPLFLLIFTIESKKTLYITLASVCVSIFFIYAVLYPIVIWPIFNKFEPLEEGSLKDKIL